MKKLILLFAIAAIFTGCTTIGELPISVKGSVTNISRTDSTLTINTQARVQGNLDGKLKQLANGEEVDFNGQKIQIVRDGTTAFDVFNSLTFKTK